MQKSWRLTKWRGVPIILDWTVFIGIPWFYIRHRSVTGMVMAFVTFFLLLLVHEMGHAAVARWRKVRVLEIRLLILHGLCRHEVPYREEDDVWIAWGGVTAQFAVFVIALVTSKLLASHAFEFYLHAAPVLRILIETNLIIIALNLIPVPPLDGAKAWRALPLLWQRAPDFSVRRWRRNRALERQSKDVAAEIIERLKKKQ